MRCSPLTAATMAAVFIVSGSAHSLESKALQSRTKGALQLAQVEVIESSPTIRPIGQPRADRNAESTTGNDAAAPNLQSELYYQLQILQEEVQALRGLVEEQAYQLQQLKQQRMDDYVDLDRRISQLSGGAQSGSGPTRTADGDNSPSAADGDTGTGSGAVPAAEFASYSAAVDLATKRQEFDNAIAALNQHLEQYPDGRYAANAYYWLGQIYFVQGKLEEARTEFSSVVNDYPDHNKAPEARYKLGQVYFQLGDKAQAKTLLDKVASGDSDSAPLARNFLRQNYP